MRGAHAQTILGRYLRVVRGITFRRERWNTPDGDFVDVDFPTVSGQTLDYRAPIVLLLHGLEGSARTGYAKRFYLECARRGVACIGLNFRSCSGELNRTLQLYHSGETEDARWVISEIHRKYPKHPLGAVGVSLGGNVLLKYLGEQGENTPLSAAVAISVPYDLAACDEALSSGFAKVYVRHLLMGLKAKVRARSDELAGHCDVEGALRSTTFREFDNAITAPLHGFQSAEDYYTKSSSNQFLSKITIPTQLIHALDDPFIPPAAFPADAVNANPVLNAHVSERGGHVGFVGGLAPWYPVFAAEKYAADYLAHLLVKPFPVRNPENLSVDNAEEKSTDILE